MSQPPCKIIPPARYADYVGELELTTHHRVTTSTSAALTPTMSTSSPLPGSSPPPPMDTEDTLWSSPTAADPSQAQRSLKRPAHSLQSSASLNSIIIVSPTTSDDVLDTSAPQIKKPKTSLRALTSSNSQMSIIDIDNIDDPQDEQLNKSNVIANLQEFFIPVDPLPGQTKGHMKCDPCVWVLSFFPQLLSHHSS